MSDDQSRPDMVSIFLDEVKADWQRGGLWRVLPWILLACWGVSYVATLFVPGELFQKAQWQTLAALYAGVLAFNAITLALTWSAIGKIYQTISDPEFSRFLRVGGVLYGYLFYIWLLHVAQFTAAVVSLAALICIVMPVGEPVSRFLFGAVIGVTLYALRWAAGSVQIVQDISWHFASFNELTPDEKATFRARLAEVAK